LLRDDTTRKGKTRSGTSSSRGDDDRLRFDRVNDELVFKRGSGRFAKPECYNQGAEIARFFGNPIELRNRENCEYGMSVRSSKTRKVIHSLSIPLAEADLDIDAPVSILISTTELLLDPKFLSMLILNDDRFEGGASSSPPF